MQSYSFLKISESKDTPFQEIVTTGERRRTESTAINSGHLCCIRWCMHFNRTNVLVYTLNASYLINMQVKHCKIQICIDNSLGLLRKVCFWALVCFKSSNAKLTLPLWWSPLSFLNLALSFSIISIRLLLDPLILLLTNYISHKVSPIMSISGPRKWPTTSVSGARNYLDHFNDFWAQKLIHFISFWSH